MSALGATAATTLTIGIIFISISFPVIMIAKRLGTVIWGFAGVATGALFVFVTFLMLTAGGITQAFGRDLDGRYAASPLKPWFDSLKSGKGPCCSDADGSAVADVDWDTKDGHYRVRLEGAWHDVPDDAVIKEPNRDGRTMVWPVLYRGLGTPLLVDIRCFMPGMMS